MNFKIQSMEEGPIKCCSMQWGVSHLIMLMAVSWNWKLCVNSFQAMFGVPFGPEIDIWSLGCIVHCSWGKWLIDQVYVLTMIKKSLMNIMLSVRANDRWYLEVLWWIFLCISLVRKWNNVLLIWTLVSVVYRQTFISGRK